ncbi:pseudouridine synthase [Clostridia bacterium]|nr:pseudouridine synthase [Clostridia bacterium]
MPNNSIRIQKIISESGYCSRRKAEEYIAAGIVKVNGRPAGIGDKADPRCDIVTINGEKIAKRGNLLYLKLYKPRGYVTTLEDDRGRKIISELVSDIPERLFPVGRLDMNSEGLVLLTNDGDFANSITHPSYVIKKRYRVTVKGEVFDEQISRLSSGVNISEDKAKREMTKPCEINVLSMEENRTVLEFILTEGKNRQIRRMCDTEKLEIARLKRTSIGGVKLGMMKPGEHLPLTEEELKLLKSGKTKRN